MEMELIQRHFPNIGVIEGYLPEETIDNLWKLIKKAKKQPEDMKPELAGNIGSSLRLDVNSPLIDDFSKNIIPMYIEHTIRSYGLPWRAKAEKGQSWKLTSFWVNFQKQNEFNPPHDHDGVYSFVIWMKIPTEFAEQRELPIARDSNAGNLISNFAFTYTNTMGKICDFAYNMEKQAEGYMVFFPSHLKHQVFPFYENDGVRISISGNVDIA